MTGGEEGSDGGTGGPGRSDTEVFGPYRLVELLGRGGMGEVWQAFDTRRERTVALKRLAGGWADVPAFQQRFRLEARATAALQSEHVIVIHDYGEIDGRLFIDMRLVSGGDLAGLLDSRPGGLTATAAVDLCRQIADGLDAAHRAHLVHRDVKPSNVMLAPDTGGQRAYLVDFGIAKLADELGGDGLTATGAPLGTPAYMAPELYTGSGAASVASDVYALGCVLFQMLTGRRVFTGATGTALMHQHLYEAPTPPSSVRGDLAPFDAVVARALAKDPARRHPGAGALAADASEALDAAALTLPNPGPRPAAVGVPRPWWRTRSAALVAVAVVVVVAVGVVLGVAVSPSPPPPTLPPASAAPHAVVPGVAARVAVPLQGPAGVEGSPDGRRLYVADADGDHLVVVDQTSGGVVATVPVVGPVSAAPTPDGRRVYVTSTGNDQAPGRTVSVVDTATDVVVATVPVGLEPYGVVVSPDGRRAYVTNSGTDTEGGTTVSIIDTATNAVVGTAPTGSAPLRPGILPNGSRMYVPNYGPIAEAGSTVTVLDLATNATTTLPAGANSPASAVPAPDGRRVYIVCRGANGEPGAIQVLDTSTNTLTALEDPARPVNKPLAAALSPDGRTLVVPDRGEDNAPGTTVSVIDTVTGETRKVPLTGRPTSAAVSRDGRTAWVTTQSPGGLWRIPLDPA